MLSHEEILEYLRLRKLGAIGVLWASGGKLYFAESPSPSGYYRREDAQFMGAAEFTVRMRLCAGRFWARRKSA